MNTSVLLCIYNAENTIVASLRSVLCQSILPSEVVIVNDSSNDNSVNLVLSILSDSDLDYKIIHNKENLGLTKSLNVGLSNCSGDFVARLDADDLWLPRHLERALSVFADNSDLCLVGFRASRISLWRKMVPFLGGESTLQLSTSNKSHTKIISRIDLLIGNPLSHSSIVFKRFFNNIYIEYDESYSVSQDYALYSVIFNNGFMLANSQMSTCIVSGCTLNSISSSKHIYQVKNSIRIKKSLCSRFLFLYRIFLLKEYMYLAKAKLYDR
jgi:glycosyltransferase involved in cell wall biosynthesis